MIEIILPADSVPDYTDEGFRIPIAFGGVQTYASVNTSMYYDEDGLAPTGEFFIYLLHHRFGSCSFLLDIGEEGKLEPVNAPSWVEAEIIDMITKAIAERKPGYLGK